MIDLDSRTVMLRELAFHYGTLDVVNEDTQAFEAVYDAILAEVQEISQRPVPTPLRPRLPERIQASELARYDDAAFVENAYLRILHRDADVVGGCQYLLKLRSGELSKDDVMFSLRMSREGEQVGGIVEGAKISRQMMKLLTGYEGCKFVENAYNWVLGREPSEAEIKRHLDLLENGLSKQELLEAFANAPERGDVPIKQASEARPALQREEMLVALESMSARFTREIDALKARDASSSIQVCVAQRQAEITRQQAETALARLADVQRQLAEQKTMIERIPVGLDDADV